MVFVLMVELMGFGLGLERFLKLEICWIRGLDGWMILEFIIWLSLGTGSWNLELGDWNLGLIIFLINLIVEDSLDIWCSI